MPAEELLVCRVEILQYLCQRLWILFSGEENGDRFAAREFSTPLCREIIE